MRRLKMLADDPAKVFDACVDGISDKTLAERFRNAWIEVLVRFKTYEELAINNQLHTCVATEHGNGAQEVLIGLSKKDLVDLYSKQMVGDDGPGRNYYDKIKLLAPLGKCPFCGFGQVSTLDHFLSKSRYPVFSVLPGNLVPACTDCNKGKGASVVTEDNQIPHPYFENSKIEEDTWLVAEVVETAPASVAYFARPSALWPIDLARRVNNYFADLKLARRFSIEAATELATLSELLKEFDTPAGTGEHLSRTARAESRVEKNSWKAALYTALSASQWYIEGGYCIQAEST